MAMMRRAASALVLLLLVRAAPAMGVCDGDCDGDGKVTVAEILQGVSVLLGETPVLECQSFRQEAVAIDDLVRAVRYALSGCPESTQTPTPSPAPSATPTQIADPVLAALTEILRHSCVDLGPLYGNQVVGQEGAYSLQCMPGPGHRTTGSLKRYANEAETAAALAAQAPSDAQPFAFHDLPALSWERDIPLDPTSHRPEYHGVLWTVGCWLITVSAFDDTDYHPLAPEYVSDQIFDHVVQTGLIGGCQQ